MDVAETKEMETETRLDADRSKRGFDAYRDRDDHELLHATGVDQAM